jgi:hypothetical protein
LSVVQLEIHKVLVHVGQVRKHLDGTRHVARVA